ncbi:hypothetical protein KQR54_18785 [Mycobacterium gordonae]|nr:hypothetical protein [Mycobacterium gordonae]
MANTLAYASLFQDELDKQMISGATSGWMEVNEKLVKYNGGNEVKIPSMLMDGLGDYDRDTGYVKGSVTLAWQTHTLTQDRGRTFSLDAMDVDETNFVASAGAVLGEFQRTKVIPEVDAYRYSLIATKAIAASKAVGGYTPAAATILTTLLTNIALVQDEVGEDAELVVTMSIPTGTILDTDEKISKKLDVVDFRQGEIVLKVKGLNGIPIIRAPSARLKTAYTFRDGSTSGQEAGGFVAAAGAKDINWIISARSAPIAVSKTEKLRIFDPDTNQDANAWKFDYRKYHDLWVPTNKLQATYVNIKQALS